MLFEARALELPHLIPPSSVSPEVRCERIISSDRPRWHWFDWTLTSALVLAAECRYWPVSHNLFPSQTDTCWCMERMTVSDRSTMSWDKEISSLQGICLSSRRPTSVRHSLKREVGRSRWPLWALRHVSFLHETIWLGFGRNVQFMSSRSVKMHCLKRCFKSFLMSCFPFQNVLHPNNSVCMFLCMLFCSEHLCWICYLLTNVTTVKSAIHIFPPPEIAMWLFPPPTIDIER